MADNDFNIITPVENLQNVPSLTPTGERQERKRRQNPPRKGQGPEETPPKEATEGQTPGRGDDAHQIDYCA
jgi:hypothetical protein